MYMIAKNFGLYKKQWSMWLHADVGRSTQELVDIAQNHHEGNGTWYKEQNHHIIQSYF